MIADNISTDAASNQETWKPLLELASREVFEIMLASKLQKTEIPPPGILEFTGMVGLAGRLCGVLSLRCDSQSASAMAAKMLGIPALEVGEQVWDAIGEIANMIAGNFKNKLAGMGDSCMLSVPTVITGSNYSCHSLADSGKIEVQFLFEDMPVVVELEIHS